jgi:hypothetical protein
VSVRDRVIRGQAEKKAREEENARLKALLNLDTPTTEETFGAYAPQEVRDQMAASALISGRLNIVRALIYLGFKFDSTQEMLTPHKATRQLAERIFGTPGCQAILRKINDTELEPTTNSLIQRLKQTALGDDDKNSNQAAATLAKLMGLNKEKPTTIVDARTANLFLLGQKGATKEALSGGPAELEASEFLTHEPGEPERIFEVEEGNA